MKKCSRCLEKKDVSLFRFSQKGKNNLTSWCIKCIREDNQIRNKKNYVKYGNKTYHGMSKDKFYRVYWAMGNRCNNNTDPNFKRYGGRGIKCEWKSFEEFKRDMYESYLESIKLRGVGRSMTTLDRIDNDGNYHKENCRWVTMAEQAANRSGAKRTKFILYKGVELSVTDWSKITGLSRDRINKRMKKGEIGAVLFRPAKK